MLDALISFVQQSVQQSVDTRVKQTQWHAMREEEAYRQLRDMRPAYNRCMRRIEHFRESKNEAPVELPPTVEDCVDLTEEFWMRVRMFGRHYEVPEHVRAELSSDHKRFCSVAETMKAHYDSSVYLPIKGLTLV